MNNIQHILDLYCHGRYKIISDRMIEVDSHTVVKHIKKGRTFYTCDCENHPKFCNEQSICRHKLFFILFPLLENINNKIIKLKNYYVGADLLKNQVYPSKVLEDFRSLLK